MCKTKVNVLLIDDDSIYQFVSRKTLEATGYTEKINICSNGEEALQFLEKNMNNLDELPDVILLDVNMPVMNGWEFLEMYQSLKPQLSKEMHVFLVTSSMNEQDRDFSRRYDCVEDYIIKPLDRAKVTQLLSHKVAV